MNHTVRKAIQHGFYPLLLTTVCCIMYCAIHFGWDYKLVYGLTTVFLVVTLMTFERLAPLRDEWNMTGKSFLRDLKYIAFDGPVIGMTKAAFGVAAIYYSEHHKGIFTGTPAIISAAGFLVVFEFIQYWYHRLSHTGKGRIGLFLWRVHMAHHLPDKVYVVMHAVFHPINAFITAALIQTPLILLGISPEAALIATLLIDLQSLVSHFNVDVRAGFLNYIFIGTETHRFHHSADRHEAKNFGNTLALWDIVFGTFHYKPGTLPHRLGINEEAGAPKSESVIEVIVYPFKK